MSVYVCVWVSEGQTRSCKTFAPIISYIKNRHLIFLEDQGGGAGTEADQWKPLKSSSLNVLYFMLLLFTMY